MTMPWQELLTEPQRRFLNALCGDLARQLDWHGNRLTRDDWRHLLAGTVKGWRTLPGIDVGDHRPGLVMLGASSLDLTRDQCADAIELALQVGDHPDEQGLHVDAVRWSPRLLAGLGRTEPSA